MERRAFLGAVTGGLLAVPLAAKAQQPTRKVPLIGLLSGSLDGLTLAAVESTPQMAQARAHEVEWEGLLVRK